jgi:hypothetical protein
MIRQSDQDIQAVRLRVPAKEDCMRTTLLIVFLASAGISAAAIALRTSSVARADEQANARIVQTATPVLSPAQLSSLQKMLAEPIARGRLHLQAHTSTP